MILVRAGLKEGDEILLTEPENAEDLPISGLDIYATIQERKAQEEAEAQRRIEEEKKIPYVPNNNQKGNSSGSIIIIG